MATYAQFKHVELYKIGHGKNRVPNAPKSSIGEIFSTDCPDGRIQKKNGISSSRPRALRDTPVKPKDTHSRLFGQASSNTVVPMVTDTIRSNIQFGEGATNGHMNGHSPLPSPTKVVFNGTGTTPSRGEMENGEHSIYGPPRRNPVTGDGVILPRIRKAHPSACSEGNPITGDGYKEKKQNGPSNRSSNSSVNLILYKRVPPGGYSSGLW